MLRVHTENIKFNIMNKVQRQTSSKIKSQVRSPNANLNHHKQASISKERAVSANKKAMHLPKTMHVRISMC